jgi:hypothetical protein
MLGSKQLALGRLKSGMMNKSESEYSRVLELRKCNGEIAWFAFEGLTFRLADNTRYTPDFAVMLNSGELELHEVKGFWTDDAKVKIKVAAELFPMRFIAVRKTRGSWEIIGEW